MRFLYSLLILCFVGLCASLPESEKLLDQLFKENSFFSRWLPSQSETVNVEAFVKRVQLDHPNYVLGSTPLVPVVIIPSLIGSIIEAKLSRETVNHWYCFKNADWYSLWLNTDEFYPEIVNCWIDNFSLNGSLYAEPQGVTTRETDYGGISSVEYLDGKKTVGVWNITAAILKGLGYQVGKSLRAAPYDWRIGPDAYGDQFAKLKALIEDTYYINGNRTVATVSLSMGSPYFMLFLNRYVTQAWKDQYIHSFTSWSGPFGGSSSALSTVLSLEPVLPTSLVDPEDVREMMRSWGSLTWLFPTPEAFGDQIFVTTSSFYYTARNFTHMLVDANAPDAAAMLINMEVLRLRSFEAPGVRMNCVYGWNVTTLDTINFLTEFTLYTATANTGDGTVLDPSLRICDSWVGQQKQNVEIYRIPNMLHGDAVRNPEALKIFVDTLLHD